MNFSNRWKTRCHQQVRRRNSQNLFMPYIFRERCLRYLRRKTTTCWSLARLPIFAVFVLLGMPTLFWIPQLQPELMSHVDTFLEQYGLRLNRANCCVLHMNKGARVLSSDHSLLPKAPEAIYLRNNLNRTVNIRDEVIQVQRMVYDAVVRSRLLYGLGTIQAWLPRMTIVEYPCEVIREGL